MKLQAAGTALLDLFFETICCPVCGAEGKSLCPACLKELEPWGAFQVGLFRGWAMYHYSKTPRALIDRFKKNQSSAAGDGLFFIMDLWLQGDGKSLFEEEDFDLIVPLPCSLLERRERGYDPTVRLAHHLSARTGIPVLKCFASQRVPRRKSGAGECPQDDPAPPIVLKESCEDRLRDRSILIFDDLMMTEERVDWACSLMAKSKAGQVRFLTVQRASR